MSSSQSRPSTGRSAPGCAALVDYKCARRQAKQAGREFFEPGDGCAGPRCSADYRRARFRKRQRLHAAQLEAGERLLIFRPADLADGDVWFYSGEVAHKAAAAVLSHPVAAARGGLANDTRQSAQGSAAARHSGAATSARRSMTAEGAAIYGEFVELLSCFDKVSALRCRLPAVRGHALGRVSRSDPRVRSACDARRA